MITFWPYLNTQGVKSEGLRLYALAYLLVGVGIVVFWLWWVAQPLPEPGAQYAIATVDMAKITPMIIPGLEDIFILPATPSPMP